MVIGFIEPSESSYQPPLSEKEQLLMRREELRLGLAQAALDLTTITAEHAACISTIMQEKENGSQQPREELCSNLAQLTARLTNASTSYHESIEAMLENNAKLRFS